jgi:hypothetical protein
LQASSKSGLLPHSQYALLRWFEDPRSKPREELVEIIKDQVCQVVVRSFSELRQEAEVTLVTEGCTEESVVQACERESAGFLLTLGIKQPRRDGRSAFEPGVFSVDDFLTEEQEAAILEEVAEQALIEQAVSDLGSDELPDASLWHAVQPGSAAVTTSGSAGYSANTQLLRH